MPTMNGQGIVETEEEPGAFPVEEVTDGLDSDTEVKVISHGEHQVLPHTRDPR